MSSSPGLGPNESVSVDREVPCHPGELQGIDKVRTRHHER